MGFWYSQFFVTPTYPTHSFDGQTVIVTGSNTGLGKEAARHVTRLGAAKVIIACRNTKAGEEAKQDILNSTKVSSSVIEVWQLDLSSYASVKTFAERASKLPRVDVLLENAGIAAGNFELFEGHESTVTVNVISTFLLALLMVPKLKETANKFNVEPRLTIVSSEVHGHTDFPQRKESQIFKALDQNGPEAMKDRYPVSKLLEVLVVRAIAPKLQGTGIVLNMLNPGLCKSSLARNAPFPLSLFFTIFKTVVARTTEVGSRTLVASASAGGESHGKYMTDGVVDNGALSNFVKSEESKEVGEKVWRELRKILEDIEPGVTGNL